MMSNITLSWDNKKSKKMREPAKNM